MGYYGAGDYYRRGDLVGKALWKPSTVTSMISRAAGAIGSWMPGVGTIAAALPAAVSAVRSATGWGDTTARRYRRINPLNPKALRRALRRATGFEHFARKVMHLTHRRPGTTRFKFPRKRRRS